MQAKDILDFWFSPEVSQNWFNRSDELDARIRLKFTEAHAKADAGELDSWLDTPQGALAVIILLDQFSRNMFRGSPKSFASDKKALKIAKDALAKGFDKSLNDQEKQFLYLPFMHSENMADQDQSVALYEKLGNATALDFAHQHRDIIAKFGRYPHRNAVLARASTAEELEFLKTHSGF